MYLSYSYYKRIQCIGMVTLNQLKHLQLRLPLLALSFKAVSITFTSVQYWCVQSIGSTSALRHKSQSMEFTTNAI